MATLSNKKVAIGNKKVAKSCEFFNCILCDYFTSRKSSMDKHNLTRKHIFQSQLATISNIPQQKVAKSCDTLYKCEFCNKVYKNRTSLWRHIKKCEVYYQNNINNSFNTDELVNLNICDNIIENNIDKIDYIEDNNNLSSHMFFELLKQNNEFKELIVEQNKYIIEQNKQNQVLQNQLLELSKERIVTNTNCNNINNNNTTNNNHFNLQFFLNETCKNAMNMNEFIEQIQLKLSDLEDSARLGYAEGISRIFIRGLKQLEVNQRPIHCSDAKRETLYIKDGNIWEKDDNDKTKLTSAIKRVAQKNMKQIPEWRKEHPQCQDSNSRKNDLYLNIVSNAMSGSTDEEAEQNYHKIRKNIIKEVIIDK
jgi:hypothetical protein